MSRAPVPSVHRACRCKQLAPRRKPADRTNNSNRLFSSFQLYGIEPVEERRISRFSLQCATSLVRRAISFFLPFFFSFPPSRMLIIPKRFSAINHFGRDTFRVPGLLVGSTGIIFTVINGGSRVLIPAGVRYSFRGCFAR